jgi:hypothetical protein
VLSWAHQVAFIQDPTCCTIIRETMVGAKWMLAHTCRTQTKEPIIPEILKDLVDKFASREASLSNIHVVTISLIGFAAGSVKI